MNNEPKITKAERYVKRLNAQDKSTPSMVERFGEKAVFELRKLYDEDVHLKIGSLGEELALTAMTNYIQSLQSELARCKSEWLSAEEISPFAWWLMEETPEDLPEPTTVQEWQNLITAFRTAQNGEG